MRCKAVRTVSTLPDGYYSLWHIPTGPLLHFQDPPFLIRGPAGMSRVVCKRCHRYVQVATRKSN